MGDQGKIDIKPGGDGPKGEYVYKSMAEIKQWILSTDPMTVDGAGMTYNNASSKIEQAVGALATHQAKIMQIWKGPDAELAREALDMLQATGDQLVTRMREMGGALGTYATHLQEAHTKINEKVEVPGGFSSSDTNAEKEVVQKAYEDTHAREVLEDLNKWISTVYYNQVPASVEYNLPTVNLSGGPGGTQDPGYPTGSGTTGPTFRSPAGDSSGGSSGTGPGGGGSTPGGGGSDPGGSNPGGSNPGGSDPGGSNPNNPANPDPNNPNNPGNPGDPNDPSNPGDPSNPTTPTTPAPGQNPGAGNGDGTVPPVIGDQSRTTTDGTNTADPRQTDMAGYRPPTGTITPTTMPTATMPPATTISPPPSFTVPSPLGSSPGVPSVIGSPGLVGGQSPMSGPGAGRGVGGASGMPFMPFMGGGAGAGESGDLERNTYVPEDSSAWTTSHETTDPVIG